MELRNEKSQFRFNELHFMIFIQYFMNYINEYHFIKPKTEHLLKKHAENFELKVKIWSQIKRNSYFKFLI